MALTQPLYLGAAAYACALTGILALGHESSRGWGVSMLALGAVAGGLAWRKVPWAPGLVSAADVPVAAASRWRRALALVVPAALALLANGLYVHRPGDTFGLAGWAWVASVIVLVALTGPPVRMPRSTSVWMDVGIVALLVVLSVALRTWRLQDIPFAIHGDEILSGRNAFMYITGRGPSIFSTVWDGIDLPALWFWILSVPLRVAGTSLAALRLPAALLGAITVIPVYGLLRDTWGRVPAIVGALLLACSASHIHYSRVTLNNIVPALFWCTCFWLVLRGLRTGHPAFWALAGLAGGLSEYFYYGTRLLTWILLAWLGYVLVAHRSKLRTHLEGAALLSVGYLCGFGPLLAHFIVNPGLYLGRGLGVLTWDHVPRSLADAALMWRTLAAIVRKNLLTFTASPSTDGVFFGPLLQASEGALLALGTAVLLKRWRHPAAFVLLLSGIGVLAVGGSLVPIPGMLAHWTPAFGVFYVMLAVPIAGFLGDPAASRPRRRLVVGLLVTGALIASGVNLTYYFRSHHVTRPEFEIRAAQSRYEASLGRATRVRNVGATWQPHDAETNEYLIHGQDAAQLDNPALELPLRGVAGKSLVFVILPENHAYLDVLRGTYPDGRVGEVRSQDGATFFFTTFTVPAESAREIHGVNVEFPASRADRSAGPMRVPDFGALPAGVIAGVGARWSGAVYLPDADFYRFETGRDRYELIVDGRKASASSRWLAAGWHAIVLDVAGPLGERVDLRISGERGGRLRPRPGDLLPRPADSGLVARVEDHEHGAVRRVDPYIGFTDLGRADLVVGAVDARKAVRARWQGQLLAPRDGDYVLEIRSNARVVLALADRAVLARCQGTDTTIGLSRGWHPIQLDVMGSAERIRLELYWTPPGGSRALVPASHFRHDPDDVSHLETLESLVNIKCP